MTKRKKYYQYIARGRRKLKREARLLGSRGGQISGAVRRRKRRR